jgi:hypothetical protein
MTRIHSQWPTASDFPDRSVASEFLLRDAPKEDEDEEEGEDEGSDGDDDEDSGDDEDGYSE